jgi:hypothetical protein
MTINQVALANTFNEFRVEFNNSANVINSLQDGTGNSNVNFLTVSGQVSSNLIPSANITYDLGSLNNRWKDLYLSGNSIFIGDATISYDGTTFKVVVGSDEIFTADDTGASVVESTTANTITANSITVNEDLLVSGNLTVNGTETILNTATLNVEDKNIVIANTASPTDVLADGGGITLKGDTDKTLNWVDATDSWTSSENFNIANGKTYKVNATDVLTATSLGTGVIGSSLTSVGTISSGTWQGTILGSTYGGTGVNNGSNTVTLAGNLQTANAVTFSGDYSVIFTAVGTTNVTLPESGTIATVGKAIAMAIVFG